MRTTYLLLGAAVVTVSGSPLRRLQSGYPAPCFCTMEYAPVCGTDGQTYSNPSCARCEGAEIASEGPCDEGCVCTEEWDPVCGTDGETYSNTCFAQCEGVDIASDGECAPNPTVCQDDIPQCPLLRDVGNCVTRQVFEMCRLSCGLCTPEEPEQCACTREFRPVCGTDGETYPNACEARCNGAEIASNEECGGTKAPMPYPGTKAPMPYPGTKAPMPPPGRLCCQAMIPSCMACKAGVTDDVFCKRNPRACPKQKPTSPGRLCCEAVTSKCEACKEGVSERAFCKKNPGFDGCPKKKCCKALIASCMACTEGVTEEEFCEANPGYNGCEKEPSTCLCTMEFDPVCGADGKTYSNSCVAGCQGAEVASEGPCIGKPIRPTPPTDSKRPKNCACTREYNPVCDLEGKTHPNPCMAECAGADIDYDGKCMKPTPDCLACDDVVPECEEGCVFCKITKQTCKKCSEAICLDKPERPEEDCLMCPAVVPECDEGCEKCKVIPQKCKKCSEAICLDKPEKPQKECQLCSAVVPECDEGCEKCLITKQKCQKCSEAVCIDKPKQLLKDLKKTMSKKLFQDLKKQIKKLEDAEECVVCPDVVPECDEGCEKCKVTKDTCKKCATAVCKDKPKKECVVCPAVVPQCEDGCENCKITEDTCKKCAKAKCLDGKGDKPSRGWVIAEDALP